MPLYTIHINSLVYTRSVTATPSLMPSQLPTIVIQASTPQRPSPGSTSGATAISSPAPPLTDTPVQPAHANSDTLNVNGDNRKHLLSADFYTSC
jgi:hypothetical protein